MWKSYQYLAQTARRVGGNYVYRPVVDVTVFGLEKELAVKGLIDSGSEITMIDREIAKSLGLSIDSGQAGIALGLGGEKEGVVSTVQMRIAGFDSVMSFSALFVDGVGTDFDIILGQQDFFRNFYVTFERSRGIFRLALAQE